MGAATAATGRPSEDAVMEAAQGQISPESLAVAATQELDPRATTRYQLAELFKGIEEGGPPLRGLHLQFDRSGQLCNSVV